MRTRRCRATRSTRRRRRWTDLRRQRTAVQYREQLLPRAVPDGSDPVRAQPAGEHQRDAATVKTMAGLAQVVASILTIIPDIGAPTAMKFGGSQIGAAGRAVAEGLGAVGAFRSEMSASMAGVEASNRSGATRSGNTRSRLRDSTWLQLEEADQGGGDPREIALRTLAVHQKSVDQAEEMFIFGWRQILGLRPLYLSIEPAARPVSVALQLGTAHGEDGRAGLPRGAAG